MGWMQGRSAFPLAVTTTKAYGTELCDTHSHFLFAKRQATTSTHS